MTPAERKLLFSIETRFHRRDPALARELSNAFGLMGDPPLFALVISVVLQVALAQTCMVGSSANSPAVVAAALLAYPAALLPLAFCRHLRLWWLQWAPYHSDDDDPRRTAG